MTPKGILIAIGGNEDKGLDNDERFGVDFIEDGILSHVVEKAGGVNARIEVITTASSIPEEVGRGYSKAFAKLDCTNIGMLHVKNKKQASSADTLDKIRNADALMFSGGDQSRLSKIFRKSKALEIINSRYQNEEFVIAGTSAGAVAMSKTMICGGSTAFSMLKGAVKMGTGLGFLENVIFDSHFIRRGRFGRLTEAVADYPEKLGIGLGEDTGLIIREGNHCQTIGSGMVILFDGTQFSHNNAKVLAEGTPMSIGHMIVNVLANNDKFYIKEKKLEILPLESEFV